jgi:hypothetical protein
MLAHPRRVSLLLMASLLGAAGLTACGNDDADSLPPPADPPATSDQSAEEISLTPEEEQAVEEAEEVFISFIDAYVEVMATNEVLETDAGSVLGGRALQYLTSPLYGEVQQEIATNYQSGHINDGSLTATRLAVEDVNLDQGDAPQVTLRYCFDETQWKIVDQESGETVSDPGNRYSSTIVVTFTIHGTSSSPSWLVSDRTDHLDEKC